MTRFAFGAVSDTGRARSGNEDYVLAADSLFAVADGMGGHSGGEIASHLAIESVVKIYEDGGRHTTDALVEAVQLANDALVQRAEREPDLKGMGTTLCALALVDGDDQPLIGVINVGDSRLYLLKDSGDFEQVTEDHSLVATLQRQGRITKDEAAVHPQRNIITRALGIDSKVMVDSWEIVPFVGDRYLICSDGLYNEVDDAKVASVLRRLADPDEAARELVRIANEGGGRDNISVVVVDVVDDDHRAHPDDERVANVVHGSERVMHAAIVRPPDGAVDDDGDAAAAEQAGGAVKGDATPDKGGRGSSPDGSTVAGTDDSDDVAEPARRKLLTWRLALFVGAFALLLGVAVLAVVYVGTGTYYVGVQNDEVAIFRGRPGGVLWIEPTFEESTDVQVDDVPASVLPEIEAGKEQATLDDAHAYVANLKQQIDDLEPPPTTTTSTATSSTSTTASPAPGPADAPAPGAP